jgi:DNA-binding GntR family transcriptional regulator
MNNIAKSISINIPQLETSVLWIDAYDVLREAILNGFIEQGEQLNERILSEKLGISRGPIREAIRLLEKEGLAYSKPNRGAIVKVFKDKDVVEVLSVREVLEPLAIRLAFSSTSNNVICAQLNCALDEMFRFSRDNDSSAFAKAHTSFHQVFFCNSGNDLLVRIWNILEGPLRIYALVSGQRLHNFEEMAQEHGRIFELASNGDIQALENEMRMHILVNKDRIISSITSSVDN